MHQPQHVRRCCQGAGFPHMVARRRGLLAAVLKRLTGGADDLSRGHWRRQCVLRKARSKATEAKAALGARAAGFPRGVTSRSPPAPLAQWLVGRGARARGHCHSSAMPCGGQSAPPAAATLCSRQRTFCASGLSAVLKSICSLPGVLSGLGLGCVREATWEQLLCQRIDRDCKGTKSRHWRNGRPTWRSRGA